ncbi:hypothetical protein BpHYR1_001737 [Brachionus plicatilis]|uniref:Uncharacterized protein n=1 Tax=Brachionus plicatilis TaxID=10195 RepID=A0A3M7QHN2_BRAPC|nr:hypothetical protein BpHYR1_001737 [Brachionus plicatilis]
MFFSWFLYNFLYLNCFQCTLYFFHHLKIQQQPFDSKSVEVLSESAILKNVKFVKISYLLKVIDSKSMERVEPENTALSIWYLSSDSKIELEFSINLQLIIDSQLLIKITSSIDYILFALNVSNINSFRLNKKKFFVLFLYTSILRYKIVSTIQQKSQVLNEGLNYSGQL